jgi:hypothetical protein
LMGWIGSERRVVGGRVWIFFGCCGVVLGEHLLLNWSYPFFEPIEPLITPPEKSLISEYNCVVDLTVSQ